MREFNYGKNKVFNTYVENNYYASITIDVNTRTNEETERFIYHMQVINFIIPYISYEGSPIQFFTDPKQVPIVYIKEIPRYYLSDSHFDNKIRENFPDILRSRFISDNLYIVKFQDIMACNNFLSRSNVSKLNRMLKCQVNISLIKGLNLQIISFNYPVNFTEDDIRTFYPRASSITIINKESTDILHTAIISFNDIDSFMEAKLAKIQETPIQIVSLGYDPKVQIGKIFTDTMKSIENMNQNSIIKVKYSKCIPTSVLLDAFLSFGSILAYRTYSNDAIITFQKPSYAKKARIQKQIQIGDQIVIIK